MNLLNELENDLALAFLVEKKHMEKIDSKDARALIAKVKDALYTISCKNETGSKTPPVEQIKTVSSY